MRYSFSGHESFPCKAMWLKKGYDYIVNQNQFTDTDAVVKLGVGKNMVQSIKFWMRAYGLLQNDEVTDIAHYLFNPDNGKDPYAEDNATLWILHYLLVSTAVSSIYNLVFVDLQREKKEFDKELLLSFIKRKCNVPEQKNVFNENTVKKDIRVMLQNYMLPINPKSFEDFSGVLIDLNLLSEHDDIYSFNEISSDQINPLIILFTLVDIAKDDKTISFDKLQALSLMFCIPISSFLIILRSLSEQYPDEISYTDNSGIRNVQFLKEMNTLEVLNRYYDNDEI